MTFYRGSMRSSRLKFCTSIVYLGFFFISFCCSIRAESSRITDIRFWESPDEAQIVIDLDRPSKISSVETLSDGTFYFDIAETHFKPGHQRYPLNNNFIKVLTLKQRPNEIVRVYFRIPFGGRQHTFALPQIPPKPDRIVIFLSEAPAIEEQRQNLVQAEINRLKSEKVKIVVLDPGHGGEDPGTQHGTIIEKNYVLMISKMVKSYFDRDPRYRAILTRTGDYIIPLEKRSLIAENWGADVFASIHVNYNRKRSIQGSEIYYESPKGAIGEAERLLAETENQQDAVGGVGNLPQLKPEDKVAIVQKQASIMFKSRQFAEKLSARFSQIPGLLHRGVKRAGFRVLHSTGMPSTLLELGYISNPTDLAILKDFSSMQRIAQAVYLGIRDFLDGFIQEGIDSSYIQYQQEIEAAKKLRSERQKLAQKKRREALRDSRPYQVKPGDTFAKIAKKFKVKASDLLSLNNFSKKRHLRAGETIRVP